MLLTDTYCSEPVSDRAKVCSGIFKTMFELQFGCLAYSNTVGDRQAELSLRPCFENARRQVCVEERCNLGDFAVW